MEAIALFGDRGVALQGQAEGTEVVQPGQEVASRGGPRAAPSSLGEVVEKTDRFLTVVCRWADEIKQT